jgi:hypothetical protein
VSASSAKKEKRIKGKNKKELGLKRKSLKGG